MKAFKIIAMALGINSMSTIAYARLSTPQAVVNNDGTEQLVANVNFTSPVARTRASRRIIFKPIPFMSHHRLLISLQPILQPILSIS